MVFGIVYAANTFPTTLNDWKEGDLIEEEWGNALEDKLGVDDSTVTTSIDYLIKSATSSLGSIANITHSDGVFIVSNGTIFVGESTSTARTSIGLGTGNSPTFTDLTITGDTTLNTSWTGAIRADSGVLSTTTAGTVTSVAMSVPTGLTIAGSPITTSGTLALTYDAGYSAVLDASTTNWETAYSWGDWNGNIDISTDTNLTAGRSLTLTGDSVAADAELYTASFTFYVDNATTTDNPVTQIRIPVAFTITKVYCSCDTGTSTIQLDERAWNTPRTSGTDILSAALECSTTTASTTSFSNAGIVAEALVSLDIDGINSATEIEVTVNGTKDD